MKNLTKLSLALSFVLCASAVLNAQGTDPVLLTVGSSKVTKSEFENIYHKNGTKEDLGKKESVDKYLDLFINFKLKVREAEELKMDTSSSFREEMKGYRRQLAQPYMTDKDVNEKLLQEAYDRLKWDIRASHILVRCEENALPKDTQEAYTRISIIRASVTGGNPAALMSNYEKMVRASLNKSSTARDSGEVNLKIAGLKAMVASVAKESAAERFNSAAKQNNISDDPGAKDNGGDLGYFTSMQMVYPFENTAYNTAPGEVSMPVRTRFGYHIVKVTDKRAAQGEVLVAHIMVKAPDNQTRQDSAAARQKIDELYGKVKKGEDFAELAKTYSDDKPSARNGGQMQWFGTNRLPFEFEQASFALKNKGDYSGVVRTKYGWHVIKLIDKKGVPTFEESRNDLKSKISRDSRSQKAKASLISRIKMDYGFKETRAKKNFPALEECYKILDTNYFQGKWSAAKSASMSKPLFSLQDKQYTQGDFAKYLESHQTVRPKTDVPMIINTMYDQFVNETCYNYEEARLDQKFPEFKALMQEYRDGILLFELTDKKVWSKAIKDTTGAKEYFANHRESYQWGERADASVYTCADDKIAKQVHTLLAQKKSDKDILAVVNKDSQLNLQVETKLFSKGENKAVDANWKQGTSADKKEENKVSFVVVRKMMKPGAKEYSEARGLVTSDYQSTLEKAWIEELKKKYTVSVDKEVLSTVK